MNCLGPIASQEQSGGGVTGKLGERKLSSELATVLGGRREDANLRPGGGRKKGKCGGRTSGNQP